MAATFRPLLTRVIACAVLALAVAPAVAQASDPPPIPVPAADSMMATAHGFAVARWGVDPCGGQVGVSWTHMGAGINARSQWLSIDVHNALTFSACSISYNLDVDWDWPKLCTVVEHEMGHLAGHDHVDDPHDVMSPYYVYPAPECAAGTQRNTVTTAPISSSRKASSKKPAAKRKAAAKHKASAKAKAKARARARAKARAKARARAKQRASLTAKYGPRKSYRKSG